jgi:hypothetical protein
MQRLDIGQVHSGAADGEDRVFEYSVRFWNSSSRIQIRLWDWSDEAAAELEDLDCQPGLYHTFWDKLLTRPNRDQLTVDPDGVDTHGTAAFREIRTSLADRVDTPNTITVDLKPGLGHGIVALTVEFRLRSDGHKIMIETCSMRSAQEKCNGGDAARHALEEMTKEIGEREEQVRAREASIRLGYMKLLEVAKGMEGILESLNG